MLLTTGPTGSGKTTTLYSILNKINSTEKNIITVEDPVEYQLPGVSQVQINKKAGLTFASALRSFLRQDPDIIMVGEIRDLETAQIAVEASLTGHLVLSTLHTNSAPEAVMRLADMGIESYLIAATVIGIMAQRLCRKICTNCKQPYQIPATELSRFGFIATDPNQMVTLYRGAGCEECRHKGYKGRIGLYELLAMNEEIAELVVRRAPVADIRDAAKSWRNEGIARRRPHKGSRGHDHPGRSHARRLHGWLLEVGYCSVDCSLGPRKGAEAIGRYWYTGRATLWRCSMRLCKPYEIGEMAYRLG